MQQFAGTSAGAVHEAVARYEIDGTIMPALLAGSTSCIRQAHIFSGKHEDMDGRNESGHDGRVVWASKS